MASRYYFQKEVVHHGLNKYRLVKAATQYELNQKVYALERQWNEEWERKQERQNKILQEEAAISYAQQATEEATRKISAIENILQNSLIPIELKAEEIKDFSEFSKIKPSEPQLVALPVEPQKTDVEFSRISFLAKIIPSIKIKQQENNLHKFEIAHKDWEKTYDLVCKNNKEKEKLYEETLAEWNREKKQFLDDQATKNKEIDLMFDGVSKKVENDINNCLLILLQKTKSVFENENEYFVEYHADTDSLIIDIALPSIDDIPKLKSVSYIKSRKEYKDSFLSDTAVKKLYDSAIYQTVLQTLNYIFSFGKKYSIIDTVFLNGRTKTIDKATGQEIEPYILSVSCKRSEFESLNLSAIDPKSWFKSSKGISAATFSVVTPIAPLVVMDKNDKRFVDSYSVANSLSEGTNLAAMDWMDFENLIREIFEQEFSFNGGEVKITQASRDGGVDAVAFDPDPIRGGKIVIQAKRYTNVVGVSAVRDLYGTVMNEGATKGILVTTSNYGNDAYEFASNKPLTLLNGANLLDLIQKHGHKAYININEAKELKKK